MDAKRTKKILRRAWREMIGLLITAIGAIIAIFDASNKLIAGFLIVFGIFAVAYEVFQKSYDYQEKLDTFENSRPNIVVARAYTKKRQPTIDFTHFSEGGDEIFRDTGGTITPRSVYKLGLRYKYPGLDSDEIHSEETEQSYAVINFKNNPERHAEIHDAKNVIARIRYMYEDGIFVPLDREIKGLWEGNEPTRDAQRKHDYEYTTTTILANGNELGLCVALKHIEDEECYAYSLESYDDGIAFLRNKKLLLQGNVIMVYVVLSGNNFDDKRFTFRLVNPGKGRDISITQIKNEAEYEEET